jgi:hypothetical protein
MKNKDELFIHHLSADMKRFMLTGIGVFIMIQLTIGQTSHARDESLREHIIALDIAAWNAWKNKDVAYFKANTTESFQSGNGYGFSTKAEMMTTAFVDCQVKSFSLHDIGFIQLHKKAVMLTYTAMQDAACGGEQLPSKVRATVTYVKQGRKWLEAFYMDAPFAE